MAKIAHTRTFVSEHTGIDRSEFAVTVGFAKDLRNEQSDDAFLVQRGFDPAEDIPGVGGIYVEIPPQRYVTIGGITSAILRRNSFELRLNAKAARELGGSRAILAQFKIDAKTFRDIRDGLRFVFRDCACYKERA